MESPFNVTPSMMVQKKLLIEKFILIAFTCIPFWVWLISTGDISTYFTHQTPPGQILYIFSKLAGLYAYYFMALQLMIGFQGRQFRYFQYHPSIGLLTTITVLLHAFLFLAGGFLRTKHIPMDILLPTFNSGYYKNSIGYGVIGAYLLVLIMAAGFLQRKYGIFRIIHRLAPAVVLLGWLHSFNIGTETRSLPIMSFYIFFFGLALFAFFSRYRKLLNNKT